MLLPLYFFEQLFVTLSEGKTLFRSVNNREKINSDKTIEINKPRGYNKRNYPFVLIPRIKY